MAGALPIGLALGLTLSVNLGLNPGLAPVAPLTTPASTAGSAAAEGVVLVGRSAADALGVTRSASVLSARELSPRLADYADLEILVIGREALTRLDQPRLRALLEYAGRCGRLLLIDAPEDARYVLRRRAGCDADFLAVTAAPDAPGAFDRLRAMVPPDLPEQRELGPLLPTRAGALGAVTVFVAGYLAVFMILLAPARTRPAAIGFGLLASLLAAILWSGGRTETFVAWAETDADQRIARYASLGVARATGRGVQTVPLENLGRQPQRIEGDVAERNDGRLTWHATLLAPLSVYSVGSFPVEPSLRAVRLEGGTQICNRGSRTAAPAWLAVDGEIYAVPALAAGATWQPSVAAASAPLPSPAATETSSAPSLAAALDLLRRRAEGLALLQRLEVPGVANARRAWLMRRERQRGGDGACGG